MAGAELTVVLEDQVAIVTGAAGGIGRALVAAMAAAGARVVAADLDASAVGRLDGAALSVPTDVTSPVDVQRLVAATVGALGRVDLLVNNAAVCPLGGVLDTGVEAWRRVFAVNVDGAYALCRAALAVMVDQDPHAATGCRGRIVNVSSAAAEKGRPHLPAYGASKAALNHLSLSLADAFGDRLVSTWTVYPGNVREGIWRDIGPGLAALEGRPVDELLASRVFQTADDVAAMVVEALADPGMARNGTTLWTERG